LYGLGTTVKLESDSEVEPGLKGWTMTVFAVVQGGRQSMRHSQFIPERSIESKVLQRSEDVDVGRFVSYISDIHLSYNASKSFG
jgi:hypothetical protein